jgi:hypothetical protein
MEWGPKMTPEMHRAVMRAKQEIMAQEDAAVFRALDEAVWQLRCEDRSHKSFRSPLHECQEPECQVRYVQEA